MLALLSLLCAALGAPVPVLASAPSQAAPRPNAGGTIIPTPPNGCTPSHVAPIDNNFQVIPNGTGAVATGIITVTVQPAYIWDVNIVTAIGHTSSGQLEIYLVSPRGITVTLSTGNGGDNDNVFLGTAWDDQAGLTPPFGPVTLATFTNNVAKTHLNPEEPLSAFNGTNPNGEWKLIVKDTVNDADSGALEGWGLEITTLNQLPGTGYASAAGATGAIPDGGAPVEAVLNINDLHPTLAQVYLYTNLRHPRSSDLLIELITPTGVTLTVSSGNGGSAGGIFYGTNWIDTAGLSNPPGPVTDNAVVSGTVETPLAPQEAFAEFNGYNANGAWKLRVQDTVANGLSGSLDLAQLLVVGLSCTPDLNPTCKLTHCLPGWARRFASTRQSRIRAGRPARCR